MASLLTKLELYRATLPRKYAFHTSKGSTTDVHAVFVQAKVGCKVGTGEVAARRLVNNEVTRASYLQLREFGRDALGMDAQTLLAEVRTTDKLGPAAKVGLEMALLDALAKKSGVPVCDFINPDAGVRRISYCGFIGSKKNGKKLADQAKRLQDQGYKTVRVKIGSMPIADDIARLEMLRDQWQGAINLWVDVNQAWTYEQARTYLPALERAGVMMVEQPCSADNLAAHAALREYTSIPIMLDEGIHTVSDLEQAIAQGACDAVNLKLHKMGSVYAVEQAVALAKGNGLTTYSGGAVTSDLLRLHIRHLEFATPGLDYFSSGKLTPNSLAANPVVTRYYDDNGSTVRKPRREGLGARLDHEVLKEQVRYKRIMRHEL